MGCARDKESSANCYERLYLILFIYFYKIKENFGTTTYSTYSVSNYLIYILKIIYTFDKNMIFK